ncbi:MAG: penicillin-binding transpeptidase domain-containing protein, partial [Lachnospiraceae bacterium]
LKDEPFNYDNGKPVKNWYPGYKGNVTIRKAIEQSMNIIAVKTLTEITPQLGFNYLKNFGFTTLEDGTNPDKPGFSDIQQATALGGITNGVENIEMTAAYAAIANNGT